MEHLFWGSILFMWGVGVWYSAQLIIQLFLLKRCNHFSVAFKFFLKKFFFKIFIYLLFICLCLFLVVAYGPSSCHVGSLIAVHRLSSCGGRAQQLLLGMWDLTSQTRDQTVPCLGRRILNHWTTREVPKLHFQKFKFYLGYVSLRGCFPQIFQYITI